MKINNKILKLIKKIGFEYNTILMITDDEHSYEYCYNDEIIHIIFIDDSNEISSIYIFGKYHSFFYSDEIEKFINFIKNNFKSELRKNKINELLK